MRKLRQSDECLLYLYEHCLTKGGILRQMFTKKIVGELLSDRLIVQTPEDEFSLSSPDGYGRTEEIIKEQNEEKKEEEEIDPELAEKEPETFSPKILEDAQKLVKDPIFFWKLGKLFEDGFFVSKLGKVRFVFGEEQNKRLAPLLITGIRWGLVSLVRIIGPPATSKDTIVRMSMEFLPLHIEERGYITSGAMRYNKKTEILYLPDSPELQGETARQLRFFRSDDGGMVAEYLIRDPKTGEFTPKVEKTSIRGVITTSNVVRGDAALLSGMWTLTPDASEELTKNVKKEKLKFHAGKRPHLEREELQLWRATWQLILEDNGQEIIIPYAEKLYPLLEGKRTSTRRDADKLAELIKLVSKARKFQKKDKNADVADLYIALSLGWNAIKETILELNANEQMVYHAIEKDKSASVSDVASSTKLGYVTNYEICESLVDRGILNKSKEGRRNIYSILIEREASELSQTFGESSPSSERILKLIMGLDLEKSYLSNFRQEIRDKKIIDPITGECLLVSLRKLESSKNEETKAIIAYFLKKEANKVLPKDTESLLGDLESVDNKDKTIPQRVQEILEKNPDFKFGDLRDALGSITAEEVKGVEREYRRYLLIRAELEEFERLSKGAGA